MTRKEIMHKAAISALNALIVAVGDYKATDALCDEHIAERAVDFARALCQELDSNGEL